MIRPLTVIAIGFSLALPVHAITVNIQYENSGDAFFTPAARTTLQKAATDVSQAITTSLSALNKSVYTGTNGGSSITVDWAFSYTSPNTGNTVPDITNFDFLQNEFRVVVGRRTLVGGTLGRGGPAGASVGLDGVGNNATWAGAMANTEALSNASMPRGGPTVGKFQGDFDLSATAPADYDLDYGFSIGSLTFDDMANWHFDYATLPSPGQNDFYSVAVHEMLHSLGFGASRAWNLEHLGTDWLGPEVIALLGSGNDVLSPGQDHIKEGTMGHPIIDGNYRTDLSQEAIMDPSLTVGSRKYITDLDLAFLEDMGWDVMEFVAVPEPSTLVLLSLTGLLLVARRSRRIH